MGTQAVSVYQQVIEKTKGLSFKSQMLALNLEKKLGLKDNVSMICLVVCQLGGGGGGVTMTSVNSTDRSLMR